MNTATAVATRDPKPFLPSDMPADRLLARAAFAHVCAAAGREGLTYPAEVVRHLWPKDLAALRLVERAATGPATTTGSGWADAIAAQSTAAFLASLVPSAGASLIAAGARFDMSGRVRINLPRASATGTAKFVAEGAPIPAGQGTLVTVPLPSPAKLALIESLTRETAEHSAEDGETVVGMLLKDAARLALDGALFSNAAAGTGPAGLLNGVSATTASTGAAGYVAALSDARALVDAVVAGGGGADVRFFASPGRALALRSYLEASAPTIYGSASIPSTQLIAIDVAAFASGFDAVPLIEAAPESTIHMEDTTPLAIGTAGSPATVAAPTRSFFQTDSIALRMILRCSWCMRAPAIAVISSGMVW